MSGIHRANPAAAVEIQRDLACGAGEPVQSGRGCGPCGGRENRIPAAGNLSSLFCLAERRPWCRVSGPSRAGIRAREHRHRNPARPDGCTVRNLTRVLAAALVIASADAQPPTGIPSGAERAYAAVKDRVDSGPAMEIERFMDQYWRLAANPGFNASVDHIRDKLQAAGLAPRIEEFAARGRGWDYQVGTVAFADTGEVLLSRDVDHISLCINSFSTPKGGVV